VVAGFLALLSACERPQPERPGAGARAAVAVRVADVQSDTLRETVRGVGTLQAVETVDLKPEIDGLIAAIDVAEGEQVEKGQRLFSLDDRKLLRQRQATQAALRAAVVRRDDAQREYRRISDLFERGIETQTRHDAAEAVYLAADAEVARWEAEVELVQARLEDTQITAPFAGVISEHDVDPGAYVRAGDHLATLHRVAETEVAFTIPERFMGRVRTGQPVAVTVTAFPGREFPGEVNFVSPQIDETTRDFLVRARVDNPDSLLKPGAFATAVVTIGERAAVPVVPEEALVATRSGYIVFVINSHTARRRAVQIGLRAAGKVEIRSGLEPGEAVVVAGQLSVSDGVSVRLSGEAAAEDASAPRPSAAGAEARP
jgi:membrane fusion protein (multidrug efflux system)